jgi:hypothetical protein
MNRAESGSRVARSRTPASLSLYDTILDRLLQDLQDVAAELRQLNQEEHPIARE